jgi:hypothetical protein
MPRWRPSTGKNAQVAPLSTIVCRHDTEHPEESSPNTVQKTPPKQKDQTMLKASTMLDANLDAKVEKIDQRKSNYD